MGHYVPRHHGASLSLGPRPSLGLTAVIKLFQRHKDGLLRMTAKRNDSVTINDAEGIMTAKRNDGEAK